MQGQIRLTVQDIKNMLKGKRPNDGIGYLIYWNDPEQDETHSSTSQIIILDRPFQKNV